MAEKRQHPRVVHRDVVRFEGNGATIEGLSVDISRAGIQVEVADPHSLNSVETIRFSLPNTKSELELPVRITRRESAADGNGQHRLGCEFLRKSDQHIRLIENYIRDTVALPDQDGRQIPRITTSIPVEWDDGRSRGTIENISLTGVRISTERAVEVHRDLHLTFTLPERGGATKASARVVYTIREESSRNVRFGATFVDLPQVHRARINNFIEQTTAVTSLKSVWARLNTDGGRGYTLEGHELAVILQRVPGIVFHILMEGDLSIHTATASYDGGEREMRFTLVPQSGSSPSQPGQRLFVTFTALGSNYYFAAPITGISRPDATAAGSGTVENRDGVSQVVTRWPQHIHRSDDRADHRSPVESDQRLSLRPEGGMALLEGLLIDVSHGGFLCSLTVSASETGQLQPDTAVAIETDGPVPLQSYGRIRHREIRDDTGEGADTRVVYVGVETGVRHGTFVRREISTDEWERRLERLRNEDDGETPDVESRHIETRRISYRNNEGHRIVALMNRVGDDRSGRPTVVIIPPAFGKKKENPAPLALTLCTTFLRAGAPLVVIRYDGINRPGESHNEGGGALRGYEMIHYRPTQGVRDISTTLDFVYGNGEFIPQRVILITSSMSSVDARKLLVREGRVDGWISLMGVPAGRTTMMNVLAGTDIIANYRLSVPNGVRGMLGHLVDMDVVARDLVEEHYAFVADARHDMALIDIPVTWIVGRHDHWVDREEVEDIMSVEAGAPREVVHIPTGHNLRNSDDAAEAFRIIAQYCADAAGLSVEAAAPPREAVLQTLSREREGLYKPIDTDTVTAYWHSYLLGGDGTSEGYDFYRNLAEFREFIAQEAEMLDPQPGDHIADMGCGTGILTEALLRRLVDDGPRNDDRPPSGIVAVDIIPDALVRAEKKCRLILGENAPAPDISLEFRTANLEPDRYAPVRDFVLNRQLSPAFLRGRIEGLYDSVVDLWDREDSAGDILRGDDIALPDDFPRADEAREFRTAARVATGHMDAADACYSIFSFGDAPRQRAQREEPRRYDRLAASLFISYILNPDYLLWEFHRMLRPGGVILVSSMRPDSDVSKIFTTYIEEVDSGRADATHRGAADAMLNEAAALFELEEEGHFRFYTAEELSAMLIAAGFTDVRVRPSLGTPPQAYIATGIAVENPPEPWRNYA